jgi:2-hydroxy-3-keto-5-methylthiopentenyl-1-phosphate phosphatase
MGLKLFVDFDGTVTEEDVGNRFFEEFGGRGTREIVADYRAGRISARECFFRETEALGRLVPEAAERFLRARALRTGFGELVAFCRQRRLELTILSDGLDYYIDMILAHHGLGDLPRAANRFVLVPAGDGRGADPRVEFPYGDVECDRCGCCKRNQMVTRSGADDVIGFIGDGYSDRCVAQYADIVFARGELQKFCQEENISYLPYQTFQDVMGALLRLLERPSIKPRRRAELRRRELFQREP